MSSPPSPSAEPILAQPVASPAADRRGAGELPWHLLVLGIAAGGLLAAAVLRCDDRGRDVRLPFSGTAIPEVCWLHRMTGLDCPGCGLTRSFIAMAHGHWFSALRFNVAGPPLFLLLAAQIPYRLIQWRRIATRREPYRLRIGFILPFLLVLVLLAQWVIRLAF